ncbi:MAG: glycine zipper domain-containing protein [Gemmataceae bacterium]|nr:glycine zipper domain-containing protein [Gemmataceae bacterium]
MNHTERGALLGGGFGALAGTVLGGMSGNPGAGAAIGAGTGALIGGLAGHEEDRREQRLAAAQARNQMSLNDVVQLAQRNVSDQIIINQINSSGSVFNLTSQDVIYLRDQGVSERVIAHMQSARRPVYVDGRWVYPAGSVVLVEPPPPVSVGVGVGYVAGPRRW